MRSFFSRHITRIILGIFILGSILLLVSDKWRGGNWRGTINSDGKGYYAYLPAVFIYQDFDYRFSEYHEKTYLFNNEGSAYYATDVDGHKLNKYFAGTALMMLPFFLLSWLITVITGLPADGYSMLFQCGINIAALFYFIAGLWIFRNTLRLYGFSEWICALVVACLGAGTNLYYYTIVEPSMSHVYSFFCFSLFICFARKLFLNFEKKTLVWLSVILGLIVLIRPSNGVILLALPFLSSGWENFRTTLMRTLHSLRSSFWPWIVFLLIVGIQPLFYFVQTGKPFIWSYRGEGFDFSNPEMINLLFSYRKGLFVYTPVLFLSLFGLIVLFRKDKFRAVAFLLFFLVNTWILSSWWCWYYGGSYGMRAYIEYFPLFGILLALFLAGANPVLKAAMITLGILCIGLNLTQSYQAYRSILPWDGMDREKYWTIFLKTDPRYSGLYTNQFNNSNEIPDTKRLTFLNDLDSGLEWWDMDTKSDERAHSGKFSSKIGGERHKSICFAKTLGEVLPDSIHPTQLSVGIWIWMEDVGSDANLIVSFERDGKPYQWNGYPLFHQVTTQKEWMRFEKTTPFPKEFQAGDLLTIYVLKSDQAVSFIDDMEVNFHLE